MPDPGPPRSRLAVGLISGTSMDGVDAALVRLSGPLEKPRVRLLAFTTLPYPKSIKQRLLKVAGNQPTTVQEISRLNFWLGELFAEAAVRVCQRGGVTPRRLAVVGSHGQTIYHQGSPQRMARRGISATLQIGEPSVIAEATGSPVVSDFRTADLAAGGQGAPLVPLVDYLLLRHPRQGTVALNIGGIANLSVIPANAEAGDVWGFDTGPGNMLIDALTRHFRGINYDREGRLAKRGKVIEPLLGGLLALPFFHRPLPKSAGREQFGHAFLSQFFLTRSKAKFEDLLRTATELTARSIASALDRFVLPSVPVHRLVLSGGGAHNRFLVVRLAELLPGLTVQYSDQFGLPVDAKEAIAFALLADRTLHGLPGNLPKVTGARRVVVLGKITPP